MRPKIIVILGPTASGKSALAVELAKKFDGEVISADSRQVYKGLDIGTGKITKKEMRGVPHYLLDVANPKKETWSVAKYKEFADRVIEKIINKNKIPILCGGTGFYIQSVVDNISLPDVPPNKVLRKELERKTSEELLLILKGIDKNVAKKIDRNNKRKIIRAIEITKALGNVPEIKSNPKYEVLQIGIKIDKEKLKEKIYKRLLERIKTGMVNEARKLHENGLSFKKMESFGLEYKFLAMYLQNKLNEKEFTEKLNTAIWQYARRQITWFKRDKRIKWFEIDEKDKIVKEIREFLR